LQFFEVIASDLSSYQQYNLAYMLIHYMSKVGCWCCLHVIILTRPASFYQFPFLLLISGKL